MARPEHIIRIAELKLVRDSAELEAEISGDFPGAYVAIWKRMRSMSAEALAGLAFVNAQDADAVRELQLDVRVFDRFVEITRGVIQEGKVADQETTDAERQEMIDVLLSQGEDGMRQAVELGLIDGGPPDA